MTQQEVIALALATAQQQGWPDKGRISVAGGRKFLFFGPYRWTVSLLYSRANIWAELTVDDAAGKVIEVTSRPHNPKRPMIERNGASEETDC